MTAPIATKKQQPRSAYTYTPIDEVEGLVRTGCQAMLDNHMQCWRMGDVVREGDGRQLQFCLAHSLLDQEAKEKEAPLDAVTKDEELETGFLKKEDTEAKASTKKEGEEKAPPRKEEKPIPQEEHLKEAFKFNKEDVKPKEEKH